jgi:hypothetical protein
VLIALHKRWLDKKIRQLLTAYTTKIVLTYLIKLHILGSQNDLITKILKYILYLNDGFIEMLHAYVLCCIFYVNLDMVLRLFSYKKV